MKTLRNPFLYLALALCLLAGCLGPNPERNAFTPIAGTRATVVGALEGWNEWLGVQQVLVRTMPEPQRSARIAEIQTNEQKVVLALDEYNRAQSALSLAWTEYEHQRTLATNNVPDLSIVLRRSDQVRSASTALIQIIAIWVPALTQTED